MAGAILLVMLAGCAAWSPRAESIFNGVDLTGWAGATEAVEVVEGRMVWRKGQGGTLYWDRELGDFEARLEFRLPPGGNNGLAIRYPGSGDPAYAALCEIQLLDDDHPKYARLDPRQYTGSVYGMVAARRGALRPAGEWNAMVVTVVGSRVRVRLNRQVIVDADVATVDQAKVLNAAPHPGVSRRRGYFGFAGHNDPVEFRHVRVRELGGRR